MLNFIINTATKNGFPYTGTEMPEYLNDDVNHIMINIPENDIALVSNITPFKATSFIKQDVDGNFFIDINEDAFKRINIESILIERNQKLTESDWTRVDDNGLSEEKRELWRVYRQALRDLPQLIEYDENYKPLPFDWPTPPPN
tara:strand:+ start:233 stop:664 length:432 start_codon:yes stop_codon:yes gene_type:complete